MQNKYIFCGCAVELKSDEQIMTESTFSLFKSDFEKADYSLTIKKVDKLPEKTGEPVFISNRREVYFDGKKKIYTAYYDVYENCYVDYACNDNNETLYISYSDNLREVTVFDALDLPSMLLDKGIGIMHCSFIEYNGVAILFAGNKQVGKSTQAGLWEKYAGAEVINGDRAALTVENGKIYACGIPFCGTSQICKNEKYPLKAIVLPSKDTENSISKKAPVEAFTELLGKFTYNQYDKNAVENITSLTMRIAENIPVYEFRCLKDKTAVDFLKDRVDNIIEE